MCLPNQSPDDDSTCLEPQKLIRAAAGHATDEQMAVVAAHLSVCADCESAFDTLLEESDSCVRQLAALPSVPEDEPEFQAVYEEMLSAPERFGTDVGTGLHELATRQLQLDLPFQLNEYELIELLGRGANGSVYKARHRRLDRIVAVKLVQQTGQPDEERIERFLQEMRAIGKLDHPNIVRATDAGQFENWYYLVMEYEPGVPVSNLVRKHGCLPINDACEIARQAAEALRCIDEHHIVHRDIKLSNLLLTESGQVKVLDLGLASIAEPEPACLHADQQGARGTADYMSPEQWVDFQSVDIRADLYSLGCALYKLLAGHAPFHDSGAAGKQAAHRSAEIPSLVDQRADIPEALATTVQTLLGKKPQERFQTPSDLIKALEPYCHNARLTALVRDDQRLAVPNRSPAIGTLNRRLLIGLASAAAATYAAKLFWRPRTPQLGIGTWRPLGPIEPQDPLANQATARSWDAASGTAILSSESDLPALLNLGKPVTGQFEFRVRLPQPLTERMGLFFRLRSRARDKVTKHSFHALELVADENAGRSFRLLWCQYLVSNPQEYFEVARTPLAEISLGSLAAPHQSSGRGHWLGVRVGISGFPYVTWDNHHLARPAWTMAFEGTTQSGLQRRRLVTEYVGRVGVFVCQGTATFSSPSLRYL